MLTIYKDNKNINNVDEIEKIYEEQFTKSKKKLIFPKFLKKLKILFMLTNHIKHS